MTRIQSVDCFRVLAIIAVITIHTIPFAYGENVGNEFDLALIVNQLARFAVPFFLITSGYFWSAKVQAGGDMSGSTVKATVRIFMLFVVWSLLYVAIDVVRIFVTGGEIAVWNKLIRIETVIHGEPLTSLIQGSKPHLWFLPALLVSMLITAAIPSKRYLPVLMIGSACLFVIGILGGSYRDSPFGIRTDFNFRNGPFFALICFVSGHILCLLKPRRSWLLYGSVVALLALIGHFCELALIHALWGTTMAQDYVVSTLAVGIGVAMMALSNHPVLCIPGVSTIGRYVLGVYVIHYFFVVILRHRHHYTAFPWTNEVLYIIVVAVLSFATAIVLSRFSVTQRLVA